MAETHHIPGFQGTILAPGDAGYDTARRLWNGMIDKRPGLIARCAGRTDVAAAIRYARSTNTKLAVRAGGHSFPGHSMCDGGMVIDLSPMKDVRVDAAQRLATVDPGVLWGELDTATQAFGLAVTGGQVSHTGVAGLTLGGGLGWLMRKYGLTCDSLLAAEVVTASGDVVQASEEVNPDLFWALRGGGGNFGVVTRFEFRLHPVTAIYGGHIAYPLEEAARVLPAWAEHAAKARDELSTGAAFVTMPDGQKIVGISIANLGDTATGERAAAPFRRLGRVLMEQLGPIPYTALQQMIDGSAVPGRRYYMKSGFLDAIDEEVAARYARAYTRSTSPLDLVIIVQMGGAVARVPECATAFPHRRAAYGTSIFATWEDPARDAAQVAWAKGAWMMLEPRTTGGVYVNELGNEGTDRIVAAYGVETYDRLRRIKGRYDPDNVFSLNQNIPPAAEVAAISERRSQRPGGGDHLASR
ncbi:MAG: FAD-binding oxidoreductase [Minicystis sp.]